MTCASQPTLALVMALSRESPTTGQQLLNDFFFSFGYTSRFISTAFGPNTCNIFTAAFCSFQFAYFGAGLVEKLHEDVNMYSERKTNLIVPYSFYVVFLLPLMFF